MAVQMCTTLQVVQEVSFVVQQLQSKQKRPDEVVTVILAPRAKKTVTWAPDVVGCESCKHCSKRAKQEEKKSGVKRSRRGSPTRSIWRRAPLLRIDIYPKVSLVEEVDLTPQRTTKVTGLLGLWLVHEFMDSSPLRRSVA
ncbi:unnamed protein product [Calypogeia fissa]